MTMPSSAPQTTEADPFPVPKLIGLIAVILMVVAIGFLMADGYWKARDKADQAAYEKCSNVPTEVTHAVASKVHLDPEVLRHWAATPATTGGASGWFISAERIRPDLPKGAKGKIVTWHTSDVPSAGSDFHESARVPTSTVSASVNAMLARA